MAQPNPHMRIWSQVDTTDPRHTKPVEFGRKFTSIDAHYQVMRATEVFGPVGTGWGYNCTYGNATAGNVDYVWCDLSIWYRERENNNFYGPIRCACQIMDNKGRFDKDAPKKAMTDALTKALSHLGFNADVFLGKFDDNAYVTQMRDRYKERAPDEIVDFESAVEACTTTEELEDLLGKYREIFRTMKPQYPRQVTEAAAKWTARKRQLAGDD